MAEAGDGQVLILVYMIEVMDRFVRSVDDGGDGRVLIEV